MQRPLLNDNIPAYLTPTAMLCSFVSRSHLSCSSSHRNEPGSDALAAVLTELVEDFDVRIPPIYISEQAARYIFSTILVEGCAKPDYSDDY